MSGPQFVHIETYARSVSSLRRDREATRAEEGKVIDRKLPSRKYAVRPHGCPAIILTSRR